MEFTTEPNPFQIFDYGFKDENGKIITEYTGGKLIFSAGFTNSQEKEIPVTLFYMLYEVIDGKPRHVSGASKSMVLTNNYEPVILECLPVEMPDDKEYILKGFLWSGFDEKAVIRDSVVINKK